ncbi:hypothetical protein FBEOM_9681 [Fusarium beomiforme]|uniref:Uncharacterized protein n=1 Tax=Fusarium beomiforme TaxID=44412 RepID=A0A9P5ADX4_9HYPO|nr:hypothetical protein FBEOM_9681 [Fusarium beomiforme]
MSSQHNSNAKLETVSQPEFFCRLGPAGCRDWVNRMKGVIASYEAYASANPIETAHDNIQLRGNAKAETIPTTNTSKGMDNIRKIGRLMERIEALEAENLALKRKNANLEDKQAENESLKRKNSEFEEKQAKMRKFLAE